jgi:sugar O-acyltransferase (sialic acid O-acetyltransferase NeuD family)
MKTFDLLGLGHAAICIISDVLVKTCGGKALIRIIKNIRDNDDRLFKLKTLKYEEIDFDIWNPLSEAEIFIGAVNVEPKKIIYKFFNEKKSIGFKNYCNLIHPDSSIAEDVSMKNGILICAGTVIAPFTEIGNMVTINRNVSIGHHIKISDFCTINPGANIAGGCEIGERVTIGMGAIILDGIKIGKNTVIGAGSLVTSDIPENVIAYGSPAKVIRQNK